MIIRENLCQSTDRRYICVIRVLFRLYDYNHPPTPIYPTLPNNTGFSYLFPLCSGSRSAFCADKQESSSLND